MSDNAIGNKIVEYVALIAHDGDTLNVYLAGKPTPLAVNASTVWSWADSSIVVFTDQSGTNWMVNLQYVVAIEKV